MLNSAEFWPLKPAEQRLSKLRGFPRSVGDPCGFYNRVGRREKAEAGLYGFQWCARRGFMWRHSSANTVAPLAYRHSGSLGFAMIYLEGALEWCPEPERK